MADPRLLALLAPDSYFRSFFDLAPFMSWVADDRGACVFVSRAWLVFRGGRDEEELEGGWGHAIQDADRAESLSGFEEARRTRRPFTIEYRALRADGAERWICDRGMPWLGPDGGFLGYIGWRVDVTDRRQTKPAQDDEARRLTRLIENAHDMVYRTRVFPDHAIEYVGGATQSITGRAPAEFYADPDLPAKAVHPDDAELVNDSPTDPERLKTAITLRWMHADGRVVWAEHRRVPVYDESGQFIAIEGIARDVTDLVESQRRLRESEDQLRQLAARVEGAREEERAQVARELHDELGQTLTALKLDISRTVDALSVQQLTPGIIDRVQSLVGLSDIALATVKRIATKLRPPTLDHLGLAEAIRWEALAFKARTGLRCHVRTNKEQTNLTGEQQTALFRIFQEALTNIVRHAHASAIQVTLAERDRQFELKIQDNGRGIADIEARDPGAIGLLGMRERAALVGGTFKISGRRGKGTVVTVQVPVSRPHRRARETRSRKVVEQLR